MSKKADKTVSKIRLKQIERDHRSIGSILDNREVYELEDIKPRERLITESNIIENKKGYLGANPYKDSPEKKNLQSEMFRDEQMIWKSKSRAPNYIMKRRFDDPELQNFRNTMNSSQKKEYSVKTKEAVLELGHSLRERLADVKKEMDSKGIFHPEANAHRVHCQYLLKLYRGISADKIEDPILRKLKYDDSGISTIMKEENITLESSSISTRRTGSPSSRKNNASRQSNHHQQFPDQLDQTKKDKRSKNKEITKSKSAPKDLLSQRKGNNNVSNSPKNNDLVHGNTTTKKAENRPHPHPATTTTTSNANHGKSSNNEGKQLEDSKPKSEATNGNFPESHNQLPPRTPQSLPPRTPQSRGGKEGAVESKSVIKLRQSFSKAATSDPRKILIQEAQRLEAAPRGLGKKSLAKVDFLEDEATTWMLNSLQKDQINIASGGYAFTTPSWKSVPALAPLVRANSSNIGLEDSLPVGATTAAPPGTGQTDEGRQTPKKPSTAKASVISFEKFQYAINAFAHNEAQKQRAKANTVTGGGGLPSFDSPKEKLSRLHSSNSDDHASPQQKRSPLSDVAAGSASNSPKFSHLHSTASSAMPSPVPAVTGLGPGTSLSSLPTRPFPLSQQQQQQQQSVPTDIVKIMSKRDDRFHDFLKVHINSQTNKQQKSLKKQTSIEENNRHLNFYNDTNEVKLKKNRPDVLLGLTAMQISTTRMSRRHAQGFRNVFDQDTESSLAAEKSPSGKRKHHRGNGAQSSSSLRSTTAFSEVLGTTGGNDSEYSTDTDAEDDRSSLDGDENGLHLNSTGGGGGVAKSPTASRHRRGSSNMANVSAMNSTMATPKRDKSPDPHATMSGTGGTHRGKSRTRSGGTSKERRGHRARSSSPVASTVGGVGIGAVLPGDSVTTSISSSKKSLFRRKRRTFKNKKGEVLDDSALVQQKLLVCWDVLQIDTITRIEFMRKYSTKEKASDLVTAVDRWGEAALLVNVRLELQKIIENLTNGFYSVPIDRYEFLAALERSVPSLLTSRSQGLVPSTPLGDSDDVVVDGEAKPLSAIAMHKVYKSVLDDFQSYVGSTGLMTDESQAKSLLNVVAKRIDQMLLASVRKTRELLEDVIPFGTVTMREWLMSLSGMKTGFSRAASSNNTFALSHGGSLPYSRSPSRDNT